METFGGWSAAARTVSAIHLTLFEFLHIGIQLASGLADLPAPPLVRREYVVAGSSELQDHEGSRSHGIFVDDTQSPRAPNPSPPGQQAHDHQNPKSRYRVGAVADGRST